MNKVDFLKRFVSPLEDPEFDFIVGTDFRDTQKDDELACVEVVKAWPDGRVNLEIWYQSVHSLRGVFIDGTV